MKTKILLLTGKVLASIIIVLGVIHNIATFTPLIQEGLVCLLLKDLKAVTYTSLICGSSFILSGVLLMVLFRNVEEYPFLNTTIIIIGAFLAFCGILSVIYMFGNPFAWIALILNNIMFAISIGLKINYNHESSTHEK